MLDEVKSLRILGVTLDPNLTFEKEVLEGSSRSCAEGSHEPGGRAPSRKVVYVYSRAVSKHTYYPV